METNAQFIVHVNNYADGEASRVRPFAEHTDRRVGGPLCASPSACS
ncbi:hypothetical protein Jden_1747 [Jonesia denitrificans DSM 20603]|uniref:Uncharacterized protein n=1 Tax=Jonesia denitrificans (strain ATCC 14870 / DSM 20603 / BCRC 15368 / CIP 55.134 / JCM 11481 / NBRC 15587 / NCTC 10816 / Prevot 55134) TaxID=471856 RepID=C7QZ94_JONDD|nr:hypothetical protein Jden_1747 [Jonesia denitrificans DSM 20603]SQH21696.1 Uncharacterised protein [Jonesia denitrificans]